MKVITREQFIKMRDEGYIFTPHNLYQDERTAVMVMVSDNIRRPYQFKKPKR